MHREEVDAELGSVGHRPFDRIANVEKLHVEEYVLPLALESTGQVEATGKQQFEAELVEMYRVAKYGDETLGFLDRRHVEGDDQAVSGGR